MIDYESFLTRLDALPDELWFEASTPADEDEGEDLRECSYDEHDQTAQARS